MCSNHCTVVSCVDTSTEMQAQSVILLGTIHLLLFRENLLATIIPELFVCNRSVKLTWPCGTDEEHIAGPKAKSGAGNFSLSHECLIWTTQ